MCQTVPALETGSSFRLPPMSWTCLHSPVEQKVNDAEKEELLGSSSG